MQTHGDSEIDGEVPWYEDQDDMGRWVDLEGSRSATDEQSSPRPAVLQYCAPKAPDEVHFHAMLTDHLSDVHGKQYEHGLEVSDSIIQEVVKRRSTHHSVFGASTCALRSDQRGGNASRSSRCVGCSQMTRLIACGRQVQSHH